MGDFFGRCTLGKDIGIGKQVSFEIGGRNFGQKTDFGIQLGLCLIAYISHKSIAGDNASPFHGLPDFGNGISFGNGHFDHQRWRCFLKGRYEGAHGDFSRDHKGARFDTIGCTGQAHHRQKGRL
jgi:hypothetical protein